MKNDTAIFEEINGLVKEQLQEYKKRYIPWVECDNGNTYVGFDACDYKIERAMTRIASLFNLMGVSDYAVKCPIVEDEEYYYILTGEDKDRADFIKRFLENGYKLSW